jgi:cytochrome c oxidase subunit 2
MGYIVPVTKSKYLIRKISKDKNAINDLQLFGIMILIIAVIIGGYFIYDSSIKSDGPSSNNNQQLPDENNPGNNQPANEIALTAKRFDFTPNQITVNKGDFVRLIITNQDVNHGIAIPEFGVNEFLDAGKTTNVEFTAVNSGTFNFGCSVNCGSGHHGMSGTLVVI